MTLAGQARDESSVIGSFEFHLPPDKLVSLVTLVRAGMEHPLLADANRTQGVGREFVDGVLHCLEGFPALRAIVGGAVK